MKRGTTTKTLDDSTLTLDRRMITRTHLLTLVRQRCVGCELCTATCPQEAIVLIKGIVEQGRLVQRPAIDIDPNKCNFCGECVVVCPVNALSMLVDGKTHIPVWDYEAFPVLFKEIKWDIARLTPRSAEAAASACPTEVITVDGKRDKSGKLTALKDVQVDTSNCIYCKQCEVASQEGFSVTHPFEGIIRLERSLCPAGCQACADICPTHALVMEDGQLVLHEQFCVYCGACTQICPAPEALLVKRHRVRNSQVKSGAWVAALEKLISTEMAALEMDVKSQQKRRKAVKFLPGVERA
ncbi:MAG TPA: 4Fe-4S binding protein [Anaerolineae bacterium]|mgnify:CR=1 FL=1|nr:4Fe-4S binding protein [Anaerolineae bacterium]